MQKYLARREEHQQQHQHRQDQNPTVGAKLKLCFWKFSKKRSLKERNRERRKTIKPKTKQIVRPQKQKETIIQSKTKPSIL